jgi:hypothetical protein
MSKVKNPRRAAVAPRGLAGPEAEGGGGLPPPFAHDGLRVGADLMFVFPTGDLGKSMGGADVDTSYAPVVRLGVERLYGNVGITFGGQLAFTYLLSKTDTEDAAWSLETHGYARGALHAGRFAPYAGVQLGVDLNYTYLEGVPGGSIDGESYTRLGLGLGFDFGLDVAVSPGASVGIGGSLRPGTNRLAGPDEFAGDPIPDDAYSSISYFGLRLGATLRL